MNDDSPFGPKYVTQHGVPVSRQVAELLRIPGTVVAGGAARWNILLSGLVPMPGRKDALVPPRPGDIDVFLLSSADGPGVRERLRSFRYRPMSEGHGTTKWERDDSDLPVQLIDRSNIKGGAVGEWNTPKDVIKTFGFTTEMFAVWREYPNLHFNALYTAEALRDTRARKLVVNYIIDPVRLAYRMNKYGRKGYTVDPSEVLQAFEAWSGLTEELQDAVRKEVVNDSYRLALGFERA